MFLYFSMAEFQVQDIIEEIPVKKESDNEQEEITFIDLNLEDFTESDIDSQEDDTESQDDVDNYIQVDNIGDGVERIVDVLGGIFVNSEGSTVSDILTRMNENIEKHNELFEKNNKVLYRLSKVLEDFVKTR
ncbi:hypothetical protein PBCVAN69C_481R [Paramecium bursaria Chlorella virus AN69C]|uniref:Uncharacterized protein n=2 Tax=Chlorovirus TaxID=181083 RepID=O41100_PBCV1|nr:hypothetical protein PBCV1_A618L [Paramecium bursaria Chlorella virus 1]AGE48519.1 hypothetical protein PBCVAN69C_481R [Paramecium bursaria Chlorella virus AN69C]AGE51659.1 hypothetical protein PBCVCviKI_669L [Paramecium bursaria Chlorella virus CviKI]AGE54033.1 hypothetical protein PBCVIL3A_692L [Paramecium bursaria Chlorella virus IL3A]AGE54721.1 hypothetical protein PBCVKS1B_607L [Paramecium bursaria Chlorella virus KS1B]AGE57464.1 hypothetical protein PBCVNEJV4_708L [Paramecium bursaria